MTKHNMPIFMVSPFFKLQNNTQTTIKGSKMRCRILVCSLLICFVTLFYCPMI